MSDSLLPRPEELAPRRSWSHWVCYPVSPFFRNAMVTVLAVGMSLFHLYTGGMGIFTYMIQRGVHLSFALSLIYLLFPLRKNSKDKGLCLIDLLLSLISLLPGIYLAVCTDDIIERAGQITHFEVILGFLVLLLLLEGVRRVVGLPLLFIALTALLYVYLGPYLPGFLEHRSYSMARISYQMFLSESGIMGTPLGVCATIIALFILFGQFLDQSGGASMFINMSLGLTRRSYGGPAKAAVVASGLTGTISGSAVANVVTTGTLTIPLMIRTGYSRAFAGAVEAIASSGGQLAPPVMGAAAFLMADMTGIPYSRIVGAAVIPALLFYTSLFMVVHFEGHRLGLRGGESDQTAGSFREGWHLFLPVLLLIVLMSLEFSPTYVAFWTIVGMTAISWLRPATRLTLRRIFNALKDAAISMLPVTAACASAGIVVGAVTLTGLPLKFSSMLVALSGGHMLVLLLLTMCASLIMGMGLPTAPAYILLATLVGPALTNMGMPLLAAHMFIFYFGVISAITPPVALASFAAAGIAKTTPNSVGFTACRIGIVTFIIPYMFAYSPSLLFIGGIATTLVTAAFAFLGAASFAVALTGFWRCPCNVPARICFGLGALLMLDPHLQTSVTGIAVVLIGAMLHFLRYRSETAERLRT